MSNVHGIFRVPDIPTRLVDSVDGRRSSSDLFGVADENIFLIRDDEMAPIDDDFLAFRLNWSDFVPSRSVAAAAAASVHNEPSFFAAK